MNRVILTILMLASLLFGRGNWNGWVDTLRVDGMGKDSLKYTSAVEVSEHYDFAAMLKGDDTSSAGYGDDSCDLSWGYQLGYMTLDTGSGIDTVWWPDSAGHGVRLDVFDLTDSAGLSITDDVDHYVATGSEYSLLPLEIFGIDTSAVDGWAVQIVPGFRVRCAQLLRYWVFGGDGSIDNVKMEVMIQHNYRSGVPVQ